MYATVQSVATVAKIAIILQCRQAVCSLVAIGYCTVQVPVPDDMKATVTARRAELVERIAEVDETVGELFLMEQPVDSETLKGGIRRATLALKFVPVFMGR